MELDVFNQSLLTFLQNSPTPFHAVKSMVSILKQNGFIELEESSTWQLAIGEKYYVTRDNASIIAFVHGEPSHGFRIVGAHTDSPCLKIKQNPEISVQEYLQLGVEIYGGALLNPWFDRDLSLAGRIQYLTDNNQIKNVLVDLKKPIAIIPSLAIHLDREANNNRTINAQTDIPPIVCLIKQGKQTNLTSILQHYLLSHEFIDFKKILSHNLSLYDTQAPAIIGLENDFIVSARLDNLLSCFVGLQSLIAHKPCPITPLLICNDHEEIGSQSATGAQGPFLKSVLERMSLHPDTFDTRIAKSMLISADNAHAIHPNYTHVHEKNHQPKINKGVVIKTNANHRYATTDETAAIFQWLCYQCDAQTQAFITRSDMGCGSTIGPITSGVIGMRTVDIGVPTLAMHSIRELAGTYDAYELYKILSLFYKTLSLPNMPGLN